MFNRVRHWEPWLTRFLPQDPGQIAIDVGAAAGLWTFDLSERFQLVLAFEPHPHSYRSLLQEAKAHEQPGHTILCFNQAVAEGTGKTDMHLYENADHTSMYSEDIVQAARSRSLGEKLTIETTNLDITLRDTKTNLTSVDFVKIDTEGAELDVLRGATKMLKEHHPKLLIEYHSDDNKAACLKLLDRFDYKGEVLPHPHGVGGHGWIYGT